VNSGEDVCGQILFGLNLTRSHLSSSRLLSSALCLAQIRLSCCCWGYSTILNRSIWGKSRCHLFYCPFRAWLIDRRGFVTLFMVFFPLIIKLFKGLAVKIISLMWITPHNAQGVPCGIVCSLFSNWWDYAGNSSLVSFDLLEVCIQYLWENYSLRLCFD